MQFVPHPGPRPCMGPQKRSLCSAKCIKGKANVAFLWSLSTVQPAGSSRHFEAGIGVWVHEEVTTPRQNRCDSCHRQAGGGGVGGPKLQTTCCVKGSHLCVSTDLNTPYTSSLGQPAPFWTPKAVQASMICRALKYDRVGRSGE